MIETANPFLRANGEIDMIHGSLPRGVSHGYTRVRLNDEIAPGWSSLQYDFRERNECMNKVSELILKAFNDLGLNDKLSGILPAYEYYDIVVWCTADSWKTVSEHLGINTPFRSGEL